MIEYALIALGTKLTHQLVLSKDWNRVDSKQEPLKQLFVLRHAADGDDVAGEPSVREDFARIEREQFGPANKQTQRYTVVQASLRKSY